MTRPGWYRTLLLCTALSALTGCIGTAAYFRYRERTVRMDCHQALREFAAQRRTMDRLLAAYRDCLVAAEMEALCWADVEAYPDCLEAGESDAVCRAVAS